MATQYQYKIYDLHRFPDSPAEWEALAADGWTMHTVLGGFTELCIMWHRERPPEEQRSDS